MPPIATYHKSELSQASSSTLALRERQRTALAAITRGHEAAVFSYLHRRVRRNVDSGALTQEVFTRLCASGQWNLARDQIRPRLLEICHAVLSDFVKSADPRDAAWTELCLELDELVRQKQLTESPPRGETSVPSLDPTSP